MFTDLSNWRGAGIAVALAAAIGLADTVVEAGTDTDPEWVAVALSAGKMRCKNAGGSKFTLKLSGNAADGGTISGRFARTFYGFWNVDPTDKNRWCRSFGQGTECQPVVLNDDGSISFGPSTCKPKT